MPHLIDRMRGWRPRLSVEVLILLGCLFFVSACNGLFWQAALQGRDWAAPRSWEFVAAVVLAISALHFLVLALFLNRWTVKPALALIVLVTGFATYYMQRYHVFFDTSMVRNVLHTNVKESSELLNRSLLPHLAGFVGLPLLLLWRVEVVPRPWRRALFIRLGWLAAAFVLAVGSVLLVFQDVSALLRNQRAIRHLITPGNYIVSFARVIAADVHRAQKPVQPIGLDAKLAASWTKRTKPAVLVVVVGETARAANWGLNGYARQTTPELAALDVINFSNVHSCGTNTEVSVPCMFSSFGRHRYDEQEIHQHESLLHVLKHAGLHVLWRDNQSGCKGVCQGLETEQLDSQHDAQLCDATQCLDEIMLKGLAERIDREPGSLVVVLHQLGNHGPAYFHRYPVALRRFTPTCDTAELGKCSTQEVVNSYDNALLYTDHFLAETIRLLQKQTSHDAAMVYVSDHGESLGENGIFLHGLPYSIAPKEQTAVPMVMWASNSYASHFGVNLPCLKGRRQAAFSHDNLFHTVLGMLDVRTQVYDRRFDMVSACRS